MLSNTGKHTSSKAPGHARRDGVVREIPDDADACTCILMLALVQRMERGKREGGGAHLAETDPQTTLCQSSDEG